MIGKADKGNRERKAMDVMAIDVSEEFLDRYAEWMSFYRKYPFVFAEHFLNIKLKLFQKLLLYSMFHDQYFCFIACRGLSKTWLTAVFLICYAILYPEVKIVVAAPSIKQSVGIIKYISAFAANSPALADSIAYLSDNVTNPKVVFNSNSQIIIATANENSRGLRAHVLVLDEVRWIKRETIQNVLQPFLSAQREPKYLQLEEWRAYPREENKELALSSASFKHEFLYDMFREYYTKMVEGNRDYMCVDLPFQISVKDGLKSKKQMIKQLTDKTMSPIAIQMEYSGLFIGGSEDAFYTYEQLDAIRKIKKPMYNKDVTDYILNKNKKFLNPKKNVENGEIHFLACDFAMSMGDNNDNTVVVVIKLIPSEMIVEGMKIPYYTREIVNIKGINGMRTEEQAMVIREMYDDYNCDYIVMDSQGGGVNVFDCLSKPMTGLNGVEYPNPFNCMNYDKWAARCHYPNAKRNIFAVTGTSQLNSEMHYLMQDLISRRRLKLLISENEARDVIMKLKDYDTIPPNTMGEILQPYIETGFLIEEMISLKKVESEMGILKLVEPSTMRKDRYMALIYGCYFSSLLEDELLSGNDGDWDEDDDCLDVIMV